MFSPQPGSNKTFAPFSPTDKIFSPQLPFSNRLSIFLFHTLAPAHNMPPHTPPKPEKCNTVPFSFPFHCQIIFQPSLFQYCSPQSFPTILIPQVLLLGDGIVSSLISLNPSDHQLFPRSSLVHLQLTRWSTSKQSTGSSSF